LPFLPLDLDRGLPQLDARGVDQDVEPTAPVVGGGEEILDHLRFA
jgi:hypothetical protein